MHLGRTIRHPVRRSVARWRAHGTIATIAFVAIMKALTGTGGSERIVGLSPYPVNAAVSTFES